MPSFSGLLLVAAVAFGAPFVLGLFPACAPLGRARDRGRHRHRPVGARLGRGRRDDPGALPDRPGVPALPGRPGDRVRASSRARAEARRAGLRVSFAIAVVVGFGLKAAGLVDTPLLVAIILSATSLGVIIPVLKDAGEIALDLRPADRRRRRRSRTSARSSCSRSSSPARAGPARRSSCSAPARARGAVVLRRARRRALGADPRGPAAPAGHDRADPRARGDRAADRLRRAGRVPRPRGDPGRVRRRRDPHALDQDRR